MAHRDGDGFIRCTCGLDHWGRHGAAGLLLVRLDTAEPRALLQLRASWTHGGGTWALPGGARDSHEDIRDAALREAHEEVGIDPTRVNIVHVFGDDHGNWRYDTVIATSNDDAGAYAANHESSNVEWVPIDAVGTYELHPGLAMNWESLAAIVRRELSGN